VTRFSFSQVDVFASAPLEGNPVAVVHSASGLGDEQMAAFARWTNLSETTFLLPPTVAGREAGADYRLRIFTPAEELPFAGHPTLGSAHAWLQAGGVPATGERIVQECGLGLIQLRRSGEDLAFRAPEFLRHGDVDEPVLGRAIAALGVAPNRVLRTSWIDNGPGWLGVQLATADDVLGLQPDFAAMSGLEIGVIGAHDEAHRAELGADHEVRAFCPGFSIPEDPVTGSLNAGFALWLVRAGHLPGDFVTRQGTALGRNGRVRIQSDEVGDIWVGGRSRTLVEGTLSL
jgi:PhzF family phenazine biosynthesis protein